MARRTQGVATQRRVWGSLKSGDFAAVLATAPMAKSPHFVLQHLAGRPASVVRHEGRGVAPELSTAGAPTQADSVDKISGKTASWLGLVVPKRHARRAVTRNLLKRQMRAAVDHHEAKLLPGQWVIRLRAPFDVRLFQSAASVALRQAASSELEQLFIRAVPA